MITKENYKDVLAMISFKDKKRLMSCEKEFCIISLHTFNVGSVVSVRLTNKYCENNHIDYTFEPDEIKEDLFDLPSGSGFDASWDITSNRKYIIFESSYHTMNDGMYDGWCDFRVKFDGSDFKLNFLNQRSHYLNRKYNLREYIEDMMVKVFIKHIN